MEGSRVRRGAIAGGGERSQVEGRERWWRGAVSGGGERSLPSTSSLRSLVEGSGLRVEGSDRWWRGAVSGGGERS